MLVKNDAEPGLLRLADDIVELGQPLGIKPICSSMWLEGLEIDTNEIEAGLADLDEMSPFEAAFAAVRPIRIVAKDVDAAPKRLVGLLQSWSGHRYRECRGSDERCKGKQTQRPEPSQPHFPSPSSTVMGIL